MNELSAFYVTGGTLAKDAPCYVTRQADTDLHQALRQSEFCYVLTSRQMGKSSLMVRTAIRLRQEGIAVVVLDLTALGANLTAEQWYDGLLMKIGEQLDLEDELEAVWENWQRLSPLQRWLRAVETVLPGLDRAVVLFVDEIDLVRSLPFSTDEFFAAIRECYNKRSEHPELRRLTFCLLGVATPSDLIQDVRMTPFNIGSRIELHDFTEEEATPLEQGLHREDGVAKMLLRRILYWTDGHPYLTQRLCQAVAEDASITKTAGIDQLCAELFFSSRARERDHNLIFVRERILRSEADRATLLDLYRQVRKGEKIRDDDANALMSVLRLAGLVRVAENCLNVRNRIYARVFDQDWIIANMPDAELQRQKAAYRRGVVRASVIAGSVIVLLCGGGLFIWDGWYRDHKYYYNTYSKRYGVLVGVGELTEEQVQHRQVSFRFTQKGRLLWNDPLKTVYKVEAVNSSKGLTAMHGVGTYLKAADGYDPNRECWWEFVRDDKEEMVYEKAYNKSGKLVWGLVYSPRLEKQSACAHFVGPDGFPSSQSETAAEFIEFQYSQEGNEVLKRYFDRYHKPQLGPDGSYQTRHIFNKEGLVIELDSLDKNGKLMIDKDGIHKGKVDYDTHGNQKQWFFTDEQDSPVLHKDGYYKVKAQYDKYGNQIALSYFDEYENPVMCNGGYHKESYLYDTHGNIVEWTYFDKQNEPVVINNGYHRITVEYDNQRNRIKWAFFNDQRKPIINNEGYHKEKDVYDIKGNQTEWTYFDEQDKATLCKDGYYKGRAKYDLLGKQTEWTYFDEQGKPTLHKDGYHRTTAKYDERGKQIEWAYFDKLGKSTRLKDGYHRATGKYDELGKRIETAYFDEQDKPISLTDGYHQEKGRYDERGNQIEWTYFDEHGKPTRHKDGYHKMMKGYDKKERKVESTYYDEHGLPTRNQEGAYKMINQFDIQGNILESSYFDERDNPARHQNGCHKGKGKYNAQNKMTEIACFDENGKSIINKDGYHKKVWQYNAQGNQINTLYYDNNGLILDLKE